MRSHRNGPERQVRRRGADLVESMRGHGTRPYRLAAGASLRAALLASLLVAALTTARVCAAGWTAQDDSDGGGGEVAGGTGEWHSSDFEATNLAQTGWEVVSAKARGLVTLESGALVMRASGDPIAETWREHDSLHLTRPVPDSDVVAHAVYASVPVLPYEAQGLVFAHDRGDWIRFDVVGDNDGDGLRLFSSSSVRGTPIVHLSEPVTLTTPYEMTVRRDADQWTVLVDDASAGARLVGSFVRPIELTEFGPFASARGARSEARLLELMIDGAPSTDTGPGDTFAPLIEGPEMDDESESAFVSWTTDEPSTGIVTYTDTAGRTATSRSTELTHDHRVELTAVEVNEIYRVDITATDEAGNQSSALLNDEMYVPPGLPEIIVYGGRSRRFGATGTPQPTVTITGLVTPEVPGSALTLRWRIAAGPWTNLALDPGGDSGNDTAGDADGRLGEFAVELDPGLLSADGSIMELEAGDIAGNINTVRVDLATVDGPPDLSPDRAIDRSGGDLDSFAQIAAGGWERTADGVAASPTGPGRTLLVGDLTWSGYEIEVELTAGAPDPRGSRDRVTPWFGVLFGWSGFDPLDPDVVLPISGGAGYGFGEGGIPVVGVRDDIGFTATTGEVILDPDETYRMRARVVTTGRDATVSVKLWLSGADEPSGWTVEQVFADAPSSGSLALVAHWWDVRFGPLEITPLPT
ncbi:MAG: hypothetical protein ACE5GB_00235 [Acidimicrobiales bacterium]